MFKPSISEPNLFENSELALCKRALQKLDDPKSWFNQFFEDVTLNVNEEVFRPLFKSGNMGAPNSSIRILVAMSCIKEGFRWSDETLFDMVDLNLMTRRALGLFNMTDKAPSIDTYYMFRRRIVEYDANNGTDLMNECFKGITGKQCLTYEVHGKRVRMDSKLVGSNIASYSRYRIIVTALKEWYKNVDASKLGKNLVRSLAKYIEDDPEKTQYRQNSTEINNRLEELGKILYKIVVKSKVGNDMLKRVFNDQYDVAKGTATPKDKKDISAKSLQNPYDPDAQYRSKGDQKVKGYSVNITETCDEGVSVGEGEPAKPVLNLITGVQVEGATAADNEYLQEAGSQAEEVTGTRPETINADGAYQSESNRSFCEKMGIELVTSGFQGKQGQLDITRDGDEIKVIDRTTGKELPTRSTGKGWSVTLADGKERYLTEKNVESATARKKFEQIPLEERNRRNNVEAAMFQVSLHTRNNKTRYRGLEKHRMWAVSRCLWMNFRRINIYRTAVCQ